MTSQHYEWSVMDPDGQLQDGLYTSGPSGPQQVIADGGHMEQVKEWGEPRYDAQGEPIMQNRREIPDGCIVVRRLVTRGEWEPADDAFWPTLASAVTSDTSSFALSNGENE